MDVIPSGMLLQHSKLFIGCNLDPWLLHWWNWLSCNCIWNTEERQTCPRPESPIHPPDGLPSSGHGFIAAWLLGIFLYPRSSGLLFLKLRVLIHTVQRSNFQCTHFSSSNMCNSDCRTMDSFFEIGLWYSQTGLGN